MTDKLAVKGRPECGTWRPDPPSRLSCPEDICPGCLKSPCLVGMDFKKMGQRSVRVCVNCMKVFMNGKESSLLVDYTPRSINDPPAVA